MITNNKYYVEKIILMQITSDAHFPSGVEKPKPHLFWSAGVSAGFKSADSLLHGAEPSRLFSCTWTPGLLWGMRRTFGWLPGNSGSCCLDARIVVAVNREKCFQFSSELDVLQGCRGGWGGGGVNIFNLRFHSDASETNKMLLCSCWARHCIFQSQYAAKLHHVC